MFHKLGEIVVKDNFIIVAKFQNGITKKYDMSKLMKQFEVFKQLNDINLFKNVKVDKGGHGISWNENIDLSSEEIWNNGIEIKNIEKQ